MRDAQGIEIPILQANRNGECFIEPQIKSYGDNNARFTLLWLEDHSTDSNRERVRSSATSAGITLKEWRQPNHLGVPATFFRLLECVDADIYLLSSFQTRTTSGSQEGSTRPSPRCCRN